MFSPLSIVFSAFVPKLRSDFAKIRFDIPQSQQPWHLKTTAQDPVAVEGTQHRCQLLAIAK